MPTKTKTAARKGSKKPTDNELPEERITLKTVFDAVVNIHGRLNRMEFEMKAKPTDPPPAEQPIAVGDWVVTDNEHFSCPGVPVQVEEAFSNSGVKYLGFGKLGKWHADRFRRVPPPAEKWVPKVGDWANWRGKTECGPHQVEKVGPGETLEMKDLPFLYNWCEWTPLSKAEIAEHKRREEWAKITELQHGDACECSYEECCALMKMATDAGMNGCIVSGGAIGMWMYSHGDGISISDFIIKGDAITTTLPRKEWERRLSGTIARLKAEAEAKELAMPLEFGMRVKVTGSGGVAFSKDGSLTADGLWIGERDGLHLIGWSGPDGPGTWNCKRPEFTTIP